MVFFWYIIFYNFKYVYIFEMSKNYDYKIKYHLYCFILLGLERNMKIMPFES